MTTVKWNGDIIKVRFEIIDEQPADQSEVALQSSRFTVRLTDTNTNETWLTNMTENEVEALRDGTLIW